MNAGGQMLTGRETEIAGITGSGLSIQEVAERLSVAPDTVKTHLRHVYAKLGVHNRSQLTRILLESRKSPERVIAKRGEARENTIARNDVMKYSVRTKRQLPAGPESCVDQRTGQVNA